MNNAILIASAEFLTRKRKIELDYNDLKGVETDECRKIVFESLFHADMLHLAQKKIVHTSILKQEIQKIDPFLTKNNFDSDE